LVGGSGTRLRPMTLTTPKPMLPLAGVPLVEHQLARARNAGIDHVVLATSYKAEVFAEHFRDGSASGVSLSYAVEAEPLGTGGGIRAASSMLRGTGPVVILNGDVFGSLNLRALMEHHERQAAEVTLHLREVEDARSYGTVETDDAGQVTSFREKVANPAGRQINAGTYVFSARALSAIPPGRPVSVERETFPLLIGQGARVVGFRDDASYWLDVGTPAAFVKANCDIVLGQAPGADGLVHRPREAIVLEGAVVGANARLSGGTVVGERSCIGDGAVVHASVLLPGAWVGAGAQVTDSVVGRGARVGTGAVLTGVALADGEHVPPDA